MAHAYTPGLHVSGCTQVTKIRMLPIEGEVLVNMGDTVKAHDLVAKTELPNDVATVNVVNLLGISPSEINQYMSKKVGDTVEQDEVIAENKPFISWFKTQVKSPIRGTVENISHVTGQVLIRKPPRQISLNAFIDGKVVEVMEKSGVVVQSQAGFIQGIFGIGGEQMGELVLAVDSPQEKLTADKIKPDFAGKVVVGGGLIEWEALKKAVDFKVAAVIGGGFHTQYLKEWLGYEIGVAITGDEPVDTTLILTEGFGEIAMASRTFNLLKQAEGKEVSVSGRTQIRAGVMRPEIIYPMNEQTAVRDNQDIETSGGVTKGSEIRVIREPYFGKLGKVVELTPKPMKIETEANVRVMEVELEDGQRVIVPRANVEMIEG